MSDAAKKVPLICELGLVEPLQDPRVLRASEVAATRYRVVLVGPTLQKTGNPTDYKGLPLSLCYWSTRSWPKNLFFRFFKYGEMVIRLAWRTRQLRPDLIHSHELLSLPISLLATWGRKTPLIYDAHELYCEQGSAASRRGANFRFWMWLERKLIHKFDVVLVANPERGEVMRQRFGLKETPISIENLTEPAPRVESRKLQEYVAAQGGAPGPILFYQGMINEDRGLPNVIAAMAQVPKGINFVLMGGQQNDLVQKAAARFGVTDRVFYHPPVPASEVHAWSCSADAGVVIYRNTGLNNYLCAPNKLYEYLMSGIPVVGSDFPTVRRVVAASGVGQLFDPESPESIAQAVTKLLGDPAALAQARSNIPQALKMFSWQGEKDRLLSVYDRLLAARA